MSSVKWIVEPVFLCRKPLPPDKKGDPSDLDTIANNAMCSLIRQLSSISHISHSIFTEIFTECEALQQRSHQLKQKLDRCSSIVSKLNAKSVKVPLGTIQDMKKIKTHYKAIRPMESGLFTPEQRAPCIQYAYERASIAPLNQIKFDHISMIGMIHDVADHDKAMQVYGSVLRENKLKAELMEIGQQKPQIITKASRLPRNAIVERAMTPLFPLQSVDSGSAYGGSTLCSMSGGDSSLGYETDSGLIGCLNQEEIYVLPSPDELSKTVAEAFHGSFVPIDVSGEAFYRMASFRRSLTLADRKSRNKTLRRRNTICESQKIESKLISKRSSSSRNNEAQSSSVDCVEKRMKTKKRDESCQTEQTEDGIYKTGALIQVARLNGYKRTPVASSQHLHSHLQHHLPHSSSHQPATSASSKIEFRAEVHREDDKSSGVLNTITASMCTDKGTSISGLRDSIRSEASVNESISQRLHHILNGHHQHHLNQSSQSDTRKLIKLNVDLSSPTSSTASTAINERSVDNGGSSSNGGNNNSNSNGYNLTSPVPANSVKMRDIPAIKNAGDDGRSSSGNWSASSSTHASVDSDANQPHVNGQDRPSSQQLMPHSPSGSSIGKDSVISDSLTTSGHHRHHQSNNHDDHHRHQSHHHSIIGTENSSCHDQESRTGTAIDSNGYVSDTSAVSSSYAVMQRDELAKLTGQSIMASVSSVVKRNNGHKAQIANRDSESWLKYFEDSSETLTPADGDGCTSDDGSCKTPRNLSNSRLVVQNGVLRSQNSSSNSSSILITANSGSASSSATIRPDFPINNHHLNHTIDDEAESVYSVDTDGYYTSMHTDSGLFRDSFSRLVHPSASSANATTSLKELIDKQSTIDSLRSSKDLRRDSISSVSTTGGTMGPMSNESLGKVISPCESSSLPQVQDHLGINHRHNHRRSLHNNNNIIQMDANQLCKPPRLIPLPPLRSASLLTSSRTLLSSSRASNSNKSLSTSTSVSISSPINFSPSHHSSSSHHHPHHTSASMPTSDQQHHPPPSTILTSASTTRSHSPSYPASESEQSELQMKERVKLKTCINPNDYPPLCNVTSSEASCSAGSCSNSDSLASIDSKSGSDDGQSRRDSSSGSGSRASRFFASYKAFKIKDIFKFSTLKRSRVKPRGSGDLSKHPSLAFDHRLVNADKYHNLDDSYLHTHSQNNLHRASLSSESNSPTDHVINCGRGLISSSSVAISKCPSIEKNFVTTTNRQIDSRPYMPKPLTDQNFFQTLMKKIDLRNLSEENVALQTSREHISDKERQLPSCGLPPSPMNFKSADSNQGTSGKIDRTIRPSTLILPYKINQRQVKVDIDSDGKVLYSSNSLGRRRDNHPMNYVDKIEKRTVEEEKKWLTMPIVSKSRSSSPLSINCAANMTGLPHHNQDRSLMIGNHHSSNLMSNLMPLSSTPRKSHTSNTSSTMMDQSTSPSTPFEVSQMSSVNSEMNSSEFIISPMSHRATSLSTDQRSPLSSNLSGRQGPPTFPKPRNCPNRHSFSGITKLQQNYRDYAEALIDSLIADNGNKKSSSLPSSVQPSIDSSGSETAPSMVTVRSLSFENNNNNNNNSLISNSPSTNMIDFIAESRRILSTNNNKLSSPKYSMDENHIPNQIAGKNELLTSPCSDPGPSPVRRSSLIIPGQRRSWSFTSDQTDMMLKNMVENIPGTRRSLVIDRNGPLKPTNIDDFKRLLSNARFSTPIRGRISAKELLSSGPKLPLSLAYELGGAFVNDPSSGSVPSPADNRTRIINGRLYRSPYKLNAMYPPIEEDCGEELTRKPIPKSDDENEKDSKSETPMAINPSDGDQLETAIEEPLADVDKESVL
ncbi:uncharacterized protein LOC141852846 [Brevipalpus obovatus]|uniref:uncharacterized protein LOC141852846 n=1 Tax=Brevipalpus obovatus TaxID=246614 RepID=UPI003D9F5F7A